MAKLKRKVKMKVNWVESFQAVIFEQVLRYRGEPGVNTVAAYVTAIEREHARYQAKDIDSATSDEISKLADAAIERARKAKRINAFSAGI
jgi:hypothetical protein